MTDAPKLPGTDPPSSPDALRSGRPSYVDAHGVWADEESSTRDTDAAIPLPQVPPSQRVRAVLTVVSGPSTGRTFPVEGRVVLGRARDAHVRLDDGGASREHARITATPDGAYVLEDLGSLNGTFVDGRRIDRAELHSGDRIHVGPNVAVTFSLVDAQAELIALQLYESAVRDPLTRAYNRRYLVERLASEIAFATRHDTPLGLMLFDLDHFKKVNDTHGHLVGDEVLREVSALVQRLIRAEDVFARFGGEEFVVLVRGIEHDNVARFADRIRAAIERAPVPSGAVVVAVTISVGIASISELEGAARSGDGLLRLADERLYRSKDGGRNRVTSA